MIKIADYTRYPEAFSAFGIDFTEEPGWRNRGHGDINEVKFIVIHHTASANSDEGAIRVVRDGRAGLPGPLAQVCLRRDGRPHIVAQGVCWQAPGNIWYRGVAPGNGNWYSIGIEGIDSGYNTWTDAQRREYPRVVAALLKDMNLPSDAWIFHRDYQPGEKIDPSGFTNEWFKQQVDMHYHGSQKTAIQDCRDKFPELGDRTMDQDEIPTRDGIGRLTTYENGSIYWHPDTGAHPIIGDLFEKFQSENYELGWLGYPIADPLKLRDDGVFLNFQGGALYKSEHGTFFVRGAIREAWSAYEWETGKFGYPITDEKALPDNEGFMQDFEHGHCYFHPSTGAHWIYGLIWNEYSNQKWERGIGYPLTDELPTPVSAGRFNHFEDASIYWRQGSEKAFTVKDVIRDVWADMGWENSNLGWPISNQYTDGSYTRQDFEGGSVKYCLDETLVSVDGKYKTINPKPDYAVKQIVDDTPKVENVVQVEKKYAPTDKEKEMMKTPVSGKISFFANLNDASTRGRHMGITGEPADSPWNQWFCAMRFEYVDWEIQSNGWYKPRNKDGIDLSGRIAYKKYLEDRRLKVTSKRNGKSVVVRPADVGPGVPKRIIDVSETAINALDCVTDDEVTVEWVDPNTDVGPIK